MNDQLKHYIDQLDIDHIPDERRVILDTVVEYIRQKKSTESVPRLNFICTHNSRRSQFSQLWAKTMSIYYQIPIESYSGGTAITSFNERAVSSLKRTGFEISQNGTENPRYGVKLNNEVLVMFSKLYDDKENPKTEFAAVMTCSDADDNCPFITGCELRIPLRYEDPKAFDDTEQESEKYDERSRQIATEFKYVFSKLKYNE